MVLGSALHSINQKVSGENEQIEDQQKTLAKSFEALIENVATRADIDEVNSASSEDSDLHTELEDTNTKLQNLVKHMNRAQGHPDEDFEEKWDHLKKVIGDSSLDDELDHVKDVISALSSHHEAAQSKLFYFVMVNLTLLFGILLWYSKKNSYSYSR